MKSEDFKKMRESKNLTQAEMAKEIGVAYNTYISWEKGRALPSFENKLKIERFLDGADSN